MLIYRYMHNVNISIYNIIVCIRAMVYEEDGLRKGDY